MSLAFLLNTLPKDFSSVLVRWIGYNREPETRDLNSRSFCLTLLEAGKSQIKVPTR